ncbi:MAG: hypothetical protein HGA39_06575 [Coriobacteriia bacterium]|nr:hypothetical protein [Coriobacteriia bacterium]
MRILEIERIEVGSAVIEVLVRVPAGAPVRTSASPGLGARAIRILPGLLRHTCDNGSSHGILAELADTETPHLLEHIAFELMALSGSPRTLSGETVWDFAEDGPGVFRVRLGFDDDLVALGALREAARMVDWLMSAVAEEPDVDSVVARLLTVRQRPT